MTDRAKHTGQRVYDRWAEYGFAYRAVDRLSRSLRRQAVRELRVDVGDTVVDLGCGPGGSFSLLSNVVGPDGDVLGVDYSSAMADAAAERADTTSSASVLRGDAAALPVRVDSVDGVFASLALSAMPELEAVLDEIARIVRPGGTLVVVDGQVPDGAFGTALQRIYHRLVNFTNPAILKTLQTRFESVAVVETFDAELGFIARVEIE